MIRPEASFCGVPWVAQDALAGEAPDAVVIGAPVASPYPDREVHSTDAPEALRTALRWYDVQTTQIDMDHGGPIFGGAKLMDLGDVPYGAVSAVNRAAITDAVAAVVSAGAVPVVLGGDDSIPIPVFSGFAGQQIFVVQVDAHLDWRDEVSGERYGFSSTMRRASEMDHVAGIVQIGARAAGSARAGEVAAARAYGAKIFTMRDVHSAGVRPAVAAVPEGASVVLSFDADGLDPGLCPGVLSPAFGGLGYQTMLDLIDGLAARARIAGVALVEYVPHRDPQGLGGKALARLLANLTAKMRRT
ncbi:MAG: arginase family protein [Pseudomonadota bacterium]